MINKYLFILFTVFIFIFICGCHSSLILQSSNLSEKLNLPFGTIVNAKVKIIIGNELYMKEYQDICLLHVIEINNSKMSKPIVLPFIDETDLIPNDESEWIIKLEGKAANEMNDYELKNVRKKIESFVFDVFLYESGKFDGIPNNYELYQPSKSGTDFRFKNYLIVLKVNENITD